MKYGDNRDMKWWMLLAALVILVPPMFSAEWKIALGIMLFLGLGVTCYGIFGRD